MSFSPASAALSKTAALSSSHADCILELNVFSAGSKLASFFQKMSYLLATEKYRPARAKYLRLRYRHFRLVYPEDHPVK
ncbi:MAG: hypothetical protein LAP38_02285 [Acidobacteriia bacterium]|nr:hypothetical protein [Terriglobia bacterium]